MEVILYGKDIYFVGLKNFKFLKIRSKRIFSRPPGESDAASSRRLFLLSAENSIILDFMLNIGALVQVLRNFRLVAL